MGEKILFKRSDLLGDNMSRSKAMQSIDEKDTNKKVLDRYAEKKQLFQELKRYRDGGVTDRELRGILATFKYGSDDDLSREEINALAKKLGIGKIQKKHLPSMSPIHTSEIDRAHHAANFIRGGTRNGHRSQSYRERHNPGDDVVHYEAQRFLKEKLRRSRRKDVVSGELMFTDEQEDVAYVDPKSGKKIFTHSSRLRRPDLQIKSQTSLRGRGIVAGHKDM